MKKFLLIFRISLAFSTFSTINAQIVDTCGTIERTDEEMELLPWFGNNEYLNTVQQQALSLTRNKNPIENRSGNNCDEIESDWMIPVRFWIYQASANDPGIPDARDLQIMMDELNRIYQTSGMNVRFFMICPQFVTDADALTMNNWQSFWNQFAGNNTDADAINVHIIVDIEGSGGVWNSVGDFIVVERDVYGSTAGATSLAHEIGHYFWLDHTHRNHDKGKCRQECVSRTRKFDFWDFCFKTGKICEKNGDALCDTPADPNLSGKIASDCIYNLAETDNWGDTYVPDTRNVMSYSNRSCRDRFTNGQMGIMWWSILLSGHRNFIQLIDINEINPDRFEPDDSEMPGVPRLISIGETQCHSFHRIGSCQDPVDWLRINNASGLLGAYQIEIDDADEYDNPVEEVRVWNTDGSGLRTNQVTTINSQSGTIRIFEVPCSEIINDFLVEVVRKTEVEEGAYTIALKTSIIQPFLISQTQVCVGQGVSVGGLPTGATVSWQKSSNLSISTTNGATTTISNAVGSGPFWIQAIITQNGCTHTVRKDFNSMGGGTLPPIGNISLEIEEGCDPAFFTLSIPTVQGATSYQWACSSSNPDFIGCYSGNSTTTYAEATLEEGQTVYFTITVTAMNDCGTSVSETTNFSYYAQDCDHIPIVGGGGGDGRSVRVIPNPVSSSQFTIEITDSLTELTEYQIVVTNQFGEMKYLMETTEKINQVNVYNLTYGLYHVHVVTDESVTTANFIVQH
jgi:PKD domain-containing protein